MYSLNLKLTMIKYIFSSENRNVKRKLYGTMIMYQSMSFLELSINMKQMGYKMSLSERNVGKLAAHL